MKRFSILSLVLAGMLVWSGCGQPTSSAPPPPPTAHTSPTQSQSKLPTLRLWLGAQDLITEIASTPAQMETGMMFRTEIAETEAMLFVFPRPMRASFWMRNTLIPLSCAYLDHDGVILETHDMKAKDDTPIVAASDRIQYVLETKLGWFQRNKVSVGTVVRTQGGGLSETFFARP